MKKNTLTKAFALIALFWIIASIIWTWILLFFWWNNHSATENTLTPEELQRIIDSQEVKIGTWNTQEIKIWTWTSE